MYCSFVSNCENLNTLFFRRYVKETYSYNLFNTIEIIFTTKLIKLYFLVQDVFVIVLVFENSKLIPISQ